jgi:hypothetical protein
MDGLETLRAFGWQQQAIRSNEYSIQNSQRPEFVLMALQRWLKLMLDIFATTLSIIVIEMVVARRETIGGGQVGVAISLTLAVNQTLPRFIQYWIALEASLGPVARLKLLEQRIPTELDASSDTKLIPVEQKPIEGRLELKSVSVSYK